MAFRNTYLTHKIPPPEAVCFIIPADQALNIFRNTDIRTVYINTTSRKYTKTGFYVRGEFSWILIEAPKP